jgi:TRAP-type C4-dicarboxylate transport system permease small subunit
VTRWHTLASRLCGWLAGISLAAMMMVTVADVVLRAVANKPIRGTFEIVELLLACTFFFALPAAFLRDEHIVVDVVDGLAPRRVPLLKRLSLAIAVALLAAMAWQGWISARDAVAFNDVTSDLGLPRLWYWIPVLAGMIGACLAAAAMLLKRGGAR